MELTKSANEILTGSQSNRDSKTVNLSSSIQSAYQVASCHYENNTAWGLKVTFVKRRRFVNYNLTLGKFNGPGQFSGGLVIWVHDGRHPDRNKDPFKRVEVSATAA